MIAALLHACSLIWLLSVPPDPLLTHARSAMYTLNPAPPSPEIADAIVDVVRARGRIAPLSESQTVDVMLAIAHTEGHFDAWAEGDSLRSKGWGQIYDGPHELLGDAWKTADVVWSMTASSFVAGRALPVSERLSVYARGRNNERGRELSRVKMNVARSIAGAK